MSLFNRRGSDADTTDVTDEGPEVDTDGSDGPDDDDTDPARAMGERRSAQQAGGLTFFLASSSVLKPKPSAPA